MKKIKLMIFLFSLGGGGVQRFVINLISNIDKKKFEITIVLVNKKGVYLQELPESVKIVDLKARRVHFSLIPLIKCLKREEPDILFSIDTSINIIAILAKIISRVKSKLIIRQAVEINNISMSKIRVKLIKHLYPYAEKCIVLTNEMKDNVIKYTGLQAENIIVIYNAVNIENISMKMNEKIEEVNLINDRPKVIAVGRLAKQKNYPLLIDAFEIVRRECEADLVILGEGEEEESIKDKVKDKEMVNSVYFLGFKENPYKYIYKSDIFVLVSLYEGLSNAMLEALACDIPVITTNNPDNIIKDGINGFQVNLEKYDIAKNIIKLIKDKELRNTISLNNNKYKEQFDINKMIYQYENVFITAQLKN